MKTSTKAAIYSAIVFPGAGFFIVNSKLRGFLALTVTLGCLAMVMYDAFHKAQIIANKIVSGEIPYSVNAIIRQIDSTQGMLTPQLMTIISSTIVVVWLWGVVEAFRIGKNLDPVPNYTQQQ